MAAHRSDAARFFTRASSGAIVVATTLGALFYGKDILIPVVLAVLLSFVLSPLVNVLRRFNVPRPAAVGLVVLFAISLVGALGFALARQVIDLGNDLPKYESNLRQKLKTFRTGAAQTGVIDKATSTLKGLSQELEQPGTQRSASQNDDPTQPQTRPVPVEIRAPPDRPLDIYQRILSALLTPLTTTAIVLIMVVFILLQSNDIRDRVIRLVGTRDIQLTTAALDDAASRLSRLFLVQTALNVSFGAVIALGLWTIGVPSPGLWGVFAGLMRFVPYIGSIFSAVFPILLAASVDHGWAMALETTALFLVLEPLIGNFIEPWVQGHSTGLSPLAIVLSAVLWTTLWGPIGLLIATPITMCLVVMGRHIEGLAFLDVILGDQPALAPEEIFYQRLLAGSSAEAAEQAEKYLKGHSLVDYFDSVALPGLQLAAIDAERGVIDREKMIEIQQGISVLLEDISDFSSDPPQGEETLTMKQKTSVDTEKSSTAVAKAESDVHDQRVPCILCLGARSPLDTAASQMLADLFNRQGLATKVEAITRLADLRALDLTHTTIVWISSASLSTNYPQIRYITRRLHKIAPQAKIYGSFWGNVAPDEATIPALSGVCTTFEAAVATTVATVKNATQENKNVHDASDSEPTGVLSPQLA